MTDERRSRVLSEDDIKAIVSAMEKSTAMPHACSLNLSEEDARVLKEIVGGLKKARNIVGTVVLTSILFIVLGLLTKGFWASLLEKH